MVPVQLAAAATSGRANMLIANNMTKIVRFISSFPSFGGARRLASPGALPRRVLLKRSVPSLCLFVYQVNCAQGRRKSQL
jgi:hypothetical protein